MPKASSQAAVRRVPRKARPPAAARMSSRELVGALLDWYERHQRPLPWRRTRDAYAIWVSEVMLQQTQVTTVIEYYERWMRQFPDVGALARASEQRVLHAWQGLGYYSRARRLLEGARFLVDQHGGRLPESAAAWQQVPGVGRYTAGAISSIAFGHMAPVVDGNVTRVLCRLHALPGNPLRAPLASELWQRAEELLVPERPGDVNQALMELGATLCTPRAPRCQACPWRSACRAHAEGEPERYPRLPPRPKPTELSMACGIVERQGRVLLVQQPKSAARWASLWLFPTLPVEGRRPAQKLGRWLSQCAGFEVRVGEQRAEFKHSITRYRITLRVHECRVGRRCSAKASITRAWCTPSELEGYALPAVHRRIARRWFDPSR